MKANEVREFFRREDVQVILTTAPAGLGHVRVTEALRRGLPPEVRSELVGVRDPSIQYIHRIASHNRFLRAATEAVQHNPLFEERFVAWYRGYLNRHSVEVYERLRELVSRQRPRPRAVIVVSTHFSLAHQISLVKERLAEEFHTCVVLAVVVTDDSPQRIWGVLGANYLFVPSQTTKDRLFDYLHGYSSNVPQLVVCPYPVSEQFSSPLREEEYQLRRLQLASRSQEKLQVVIPISGAAVQLRFFQDLISVIGYGGFSDLTVVSRESSYTRDFLLWCQKNPSVRVVADRLDRDVVLEYERQYEKNLFSIEVTKPSEQAFKVLVTPRERGGVILLFSNPVGRQEEDNIAFMRRHGLLPTVDEQQLLEETALATTRPFDEKLRERARSWRGVLLPADGTRAGEFVVRLRDGGILAQMADFSGYIDHPELRGDGVRRFWKILAQRVIERCSL